MTWFQAAILEKISYAYCAWLIMMAFVSAAMGMVEMNDPYAAVTVAEIQFYAVLAIHVSRYYSRFGVSGLLLPDLLLVIAYSAFTQGYLTLYSLGIVPYSDTIFYFESSVPMSMTIVNLGLIGMLLGNELAAPKQQVTWVQPMRVPTDLWLLAGVSIMGIGLAMHLVTFLTVGWGPFFKYGYTGIAHLGDYAPWPWPIIWARSWQVFLLGLAVYTVSSALRLRKLFASTTGMSMTYGFTALLILEGDRGPVFLIILSLIMVRHYFVSPFKLWMIIPAGLGGFALFTAMKISRTVALRPGAMLNEIQAARATGDVHWWSSLVEAGSSVRIVNMVAYLVPNDQPFWWGASYFSAATKVVPFLQGFLASYGITREAPSQWVTWEIVGYGAAGIGFCLPAEGYLNFGIPGVVLHMALFGALIRSVSVWYARHPSAMTAMIMLGVLAPTIKVVRDHSALVVAQYTQIIVLAWILAKICKDEGSVQSPYQMAPMNPYYNMQRPGHYAAPVPRR